MKWLFGQFEGLARKQLLQGHTTQRVAGADVPHAHCLDRGRDPADHQRRAHRPSQIGIAASRGLNQDRRAQHDAGNGEQRILHSEPDRQQLGRTLVGLVSHVAGSVSRVECHCSGSSTEFNPGAEPPASTTWRMPHAVELPGSNTWSPARIGNRANDSPRERRHALASHIRTERTPLVAIFARVDRAGQSPNRRTRIERRDQIRLP